MEAQVESAIEIAWNSSADAGLKQQAFEFLNQLRAEPGAWRICLSLFTKSPRASEIVRHTALQVANAAIQSQQLDDQSLFFTKDTLMTYIRQLYGRFELGIEPDTANIRNKLAQTITYLFEALYAKGWETFFQDLYMVANPVLGQAEWTNKPGLVFYLRVLGSVHDEIADVLVLRSADQQKRSNSLKDLIRQRDAQRVALSWRQILSRWRELSDDVVGLCLGVVSRWASWTEITLVVNEDLIGPLFEIALRENAIDSGGPDQTRDAAINTITEIVGKKMKAADKIDLIEFISLGDVISQLTSSPSLSTLRSTPRYNTDLAEAVARLVNTTACDIVKALDSQTTDAETKGRALSLLSTFFLWILRFFSDEYDEVCSAVIPFVTELLVFFRKEAKPREGQSKGGLMPLYRTMLSSVLSGVILKMRYDSASSWAPEDEQTDEAEFQELRKRLQGLQQSIAAVDLDLCIEIIVAIVNGTFEILSRPGSQVDWRELDLALHEMYLFGDFAVKRDRLYFKGAVTSPGARGLIEMMTRMLEADVAAYPHPVVQLQFMEICVRYPAFLENHPKYIPGVLEHFVRLVHHRHVRVRTRAWYLFYRFVKQLKAEVGSVSQTVIQAISDLLTIKAEVPKTDDADDGAMSDEGEQASDAVFNSQLFLFEAIGCMSTSSSVSIESQALYARSVVEPLTQDLLQHIAVAKSGDLQAILQVHHDIMALGTLARGFADMPGATLSATDPALSLGVIQEFERCTEPILMALDALQSSLEARTAARFAFSRLITILRSRLLSQLPRWIAGLLSENSSMDEMTTFLRLLEQIVFAFRSEIRGTLDALLSPLLQRLFAELAQSASGTDDQIQRAELRRELLILLTTMFNNGLADVLVSSANESMFEPLLRAIEFLARDVSDLASAKVAFGLITKMCAQWGGPDVAAVPEPSGKKATSGTVPPSSTPTEPTSPSSASFSTATVAAADEPSSTPTNAIPALPGFKELMISRFSAESWALLTDPAFNARDVQARQVMAEMASLERTIYLKTGDDFLGHLRAVVFPRLGMTAPVVEEYELALQTRDWKAFRLFFVDFVQRNSA